MLGNIITVKHTHRRNNVQVLVGSIYRCFANVTDLVKVRDGGGGTFRHIFTLKIKIKGQIHSWIYPDEHDVWPARRRGDQIQN